MLQVLPERLELGRPRNVARCRHAGTVGTADLGRRREQQGPESTRHLETDKDEVCRPLDTARHANLAVVGKVDGAADDGARVAHSRPDTEVFAPVLDYWSVLPCVHKKKERKLTEGVRQHGGRLADIQQGTGNTAKGLYRQQVSHPWRESTYPRSEQVAIHGVLGANVETGTGQAHAETSDDTRIADTQLVDDGSAAQRCSSRQRVVEARGEIGQVWSDN